VPVLAGAVRLFKCLQEGTMKVIIYGDFNCPCSYLASQRDALGG
jgi:hypothetical protein